MIVLTLPKCFLSVIQWNNFLRRLHQNWINMVGFIALKHIFRRAEQMNQIKVTLTLQSRTFLSIQKNYADIFGWDAFDWPCRETRNIRVPDADFCLICSWFRKHGPCRRDFYVPLSLYRSTVIAVLSAKNARDNPALWQFATALFLRLQQIVVFTVPT